MNNQSIIKKLYLQVPFFFATLRLYHSFDSHNVFLILVGELKG